ncbi:unnamed protein product [Rotaria magnacalcarata]|uniref:Uncharacterized protein n=3 Tax=Rotaria magnacalcarata TaxID=392030 RepID=A0A815YEY3_9BILA|nr:unnamed protein product [Rotaria magnacalcarata]CAF1569625.1 unnamed protein product [Rotaria magnacalcarata]CAF3902751.1 unnamed protein product [Rotaria magnacalcarata]
MDKIEQALASFHQALNIRENFLPDSESSVAEVHYEIGNLYFKMDQSDQALEHLCRCLELEQKSLPENHVDIAQSSNSIIAAIQSIGLYNEALVFVEKALTQRDSR